MSTNNEVDRTFEVWYETIDDGVVGPQYQVRAGIHHQSVAEQTARRLNEMAALHRPRRRYFVVKATTVRDRMEVLS